MLIRQETTKDHDEVFKLIELAFREAEFTDHQEHYLVERLRKSTAYVPELSMVAEIDEKIVGHILFTRLQIKEDWQSFDSLALAPVSVHPKHQNKGIGGALIRQGHGKAIELGFQSVILLGHAEYYPRFGYQRADLYNIGLPFEVPLENCMAIELKKGALKEVSGMVEYPKEFNL